MNGQIAPPPRRVSRVWALTLRVIFTLIPLLSLGILAWVPMLRLALVRRRPLDWALFATAFALSVASTLILDRNNGSGGWHDNVAGITLLMVSFGAAAYFPVADKGGRRTEATRRADGRAAPHPPAHAPAYPSPYPAVHHHPTPAAPGPAPSTAPSPERIRKVRAELGELSDYLRNKEVW